MVWFAVVDSCYFIIYRAFMECDYAFCVCLIAFLVVVVVGSSSK